MRRDAKAATRRLLCVLLVRGSRLPAEANGLGQATSPRRGCPGAAQPNCLEETGRARSLEGTPAGRAQADWTAPLSRARAAIPARARAPVPAPATTTERSAQIVSTRGALQLEILGDAAQHYRDGRTCSRHEPIIVADERSTLEGLRDRSGLSPGEIRGRNGGRPVGAPARRPAQAFGTAARQRHRRSLTRRAPRGKIRAAGGDAMVTDAHPCRARLSHRQSAAERGLQRSHDATRRCTWTTSARTM